MSVTGGAVAALSGVRVVEFGHGVSAPFAARLFADYGADVIKVEMPEMGDVARSWGPFPSDEPDLEKSGVFFFCNTNKRSISIDVRTAEGRQTLLALVRWADVFVENQRPGDMREWQMEYSRLAIENPELVMVSITPYGQFGPYADWLGYDLNAYHLTATGSRYCGDPDRAPLEHGTFSADFFGAYAATAWALAALYGRERVGGGQHLDVATAQTLAALFPGAQTIGGYAQDGTFGRRSGAMAFGAPGRIFPCSDGFAWVMALETAQWDGLRVAMGDPEWAESEVFRTMLGRAENSDIINALVEQWTLTLPKQVVMDLCQANNCPSTAVYTIDEVVDLPHLAMRGQIVELEHPVLGTVRVFGAPILLPDCPGGPAKPAPLLGEHTQEILQMLADVESKPGGRNPRRPGGQADVRQDFDSKPRGSTSDPTRLPLAGVRVANFAWSWIGPVTGQTLAFLGAEVYKIESHARIDINRTFPPFAEGIPGPDRSLQNHAGWAGNGSVTLNLRDPRGQDLARRIVADCDIVVENFSPGVMDRLHLGYEDMRLVRPDLVYVSMPAAGLFGPMSSVRTYGTSLSSIAGLDSITGYDESGPVTMENAFSDPLGGIIGAIGTLLGLLHRRNTGRGQHVDYSQQDGLLQFMGPALMDYVFNGRIAGPIGNQHPTGAGAPHGVFPCAGEDRWISIAVLTDSEWRGLCAAMGNPQWAADPRLATMTGRVSGLDDLHDRLSEWTEQFDDYKLAAELQQHGVAAAPVLNVADLFHDSHFRARNTFVVVEHPLGFSETIYGSYVKASRSVPIIKPGPVMGQDNERVLRGILGLSEADYDALVAEDVID